MPSKVKSLLWSTGANRDPAKKSDTGQGYDRDRMRQGLSQRGGYYKNQGMNRDEIKWHPQEGTGRIGDGVDG